MDEAARTLSVSEHICFEPEHLVHAYLIDGGDAVRRRAVTRALARRILCDFGGASEEKWEHGAAPDFIEMLDDKITIDRVRTLTAQMYQKPLESRYKVIVLAKAGNLRVEAQNALLKSLEEPPEHVVWILVSDNAGKLLSTIRSRCRAISLPSAENRVMEPIEGLCGMMEAALSGDVLTVFTSRRFYDAAKEKERETLDQVEQYLCAVLRQKWAETSAPVVPAWVESVRKMSQRISLEQVQRGIRETERVRQNLQVNINFTLALEHLLLSLR
ncbi:MAG: hypothetical protein SOR89_04535 [Ndongobacter sp.]|nr:hypothetical protein [Ndongobacter sp.]